MYLVVLLLTGAYLIGSVPFTFLYGKMYGHDIRYEGSGNVGGTNLVRVVGAKGIPGVLLDISKGAISVLLARYILANQLHQPTLSAVLFAVILTGTIGHMFPIFLGFKGGKGVAVAGGGVIAIAPGLGALLYVVGLLLVAMLTDVMSVASVVAATLLPVYAWCFLGQDPLTTAIALTVGCLVIWAHRGNLVRIRMGTEKRLGIKSKISSWLRSRFHKHPGC